MAQTNELPVHIVTVPAFLMGQTEVTVAEWTAIMGVSSPQGNIVCDLNCPALQITWYDAQAFVAALSARTGKQYRLPTEAEWEYAARAGTTTAWSCGDDPSVLSTYAGYFPNDGLCHGPYPVKSALPNAFGLYGVHGNADEWVQDIIHDDYTLAPTDGSEWVGVANGNPRFRVIRGGSYCSRSPMTRSASREYMVPSGATVHTGLRVVRSP